MVYEGHPPPALLHQDLTDAGRSNLDLGEVVEPPPEIMKGRGPDRLSMCHEHHTPVRHLRPVAPRPLTVRAAVDAVGKPVTQAVMEEAYAKCRKAYNGHDPTRLVLQAGS